MLQLGEGIGLVLAPVLAGVFIGLYGLSSILIFDMVTFIFAVSILTFVRFPEIHQAKRKTKENKETWISELGQAVRYLWARPGLLGLVLVFTLVNFFVGAAEAVLTPMVLSFTTPENLGLILTMGGVGMLIGSLLESFFGNHQRKGYAVFGAYALLGASVLVAGLRPSVVLVGTAVFFVFFFLPTVMSSSQTIMQVKVSPEIQGRVFGLRIFMNTLSFAAAYLLGGTLADQIFEPLMSANGVLATTIGHELGTGPGRGMGLMFVIMGIFSIISALSALAYPRIRHVELELPDIVEG